MMSLSQNDSKKRSLEVLEEQRQEVTKELDEVKTFANVSDDFEPVTDDTALTPDKVNSLIRERLNRQKKKYTDAISALTERLDSIEQRLDRSGENYVKAWNDARVQLVQFGFDGTEDQVALVADIDPETVTNKMGALDEVINNAFRRGREYERHLDELYPQTKPKTQEDIIREAFQAARK